MRRTDDRAPPGGLTDRPSEHSALTSGRAPRSRQVPRAYPSRTVREAGSALQFQSSSASRRIAGAAGFLTFTQQSARPER